MNGKSPPIISLAPVFIILSCAWAAPDRVWALQTHDAPEGIIAHQVAHIMFALSMGILAYWLESNRFVLEKGWRLIQLSCVLFLVWNLVAFSGHYVEGGLAPDLILGRKGSPNQWLIVGDEPLAVAYFFLKLDHLVCVPAILLLLLGVRRLYKRTLREASKGT